MNFGSQNDVARWNALTASRQIRCKLALQPRPEYHWVPQSGKPIRVASMTDRESTPYRTNWVAMIVSCYNYSDHSTNSRFACR